MGCSYTTSNGVLAPLGRDSAPGRLYVVAIDDKVAGLIHANDTEAELWDRFADWLTHSGPDRSFSMLDRTETGWVLDPDYSGETAGELRRLILDMAAAIADAQIDTSASLTHDSKDAR